jgi:hypothetical protein
MCAEGRLLFRSAASPSLIAADFKNRGIARGGGLRPVGGGAGPSRVSGLD